MKDTGILRLGWLSLSDPSGFGKAGKRSDSPVVTLFAASLALFVVSDLVGPLSLGPIEGEFVSPFRWDAMSSSILQWVVVAALMLAVAWTSRKANMWFIEDDRELGLCMFALGVLFLLLKSIVYALAKYTYVSCASSKYFETHAAFIGICSERVNSMYLFLPLAVIVLATRLFRGIAPEPGVVVAFLTAVALAVTYSYGPSIITSLLS